MPAAADTMRKSRTLAVALGAVFLAAFALGYLLRGSGQPPATSPTPTAPASAATPDAGHAHGEGAAQEAVEWTCVMHPWIRLSKPGKCPICGMDLVPAHKSETGSATVASLRQVTLSPSALALAQVETVPARRLGVGVDTRLFGKVTYDESTMAIITAWVPGRLDKLYVDQTGVTVTKGQKMAEIYSPELLAAQGELVEAGKASARFGSSDNAAIREAAAATERAAREKLRLLGLSPAQVAAIASRGAPADHVVLTAPMGGVVVRKDVVEGAYVVTGARLFAIADLRTVWVELDAYEKDLPWVHVGDAARFEAEALPGRVFTGKVVFIDSILNNMTRTVRVRLEVPNADGALKPGMLVHGLQQTPAAQGQKPLVIPASAPLVTGKRAVVYVAAPGATGVYEGREIVLGPKAGNSYVVENGLQEGEQVVTRGSFMIDSSAQIEAKPSMMTPEGGQAASPHQHGGTMAQAAPGQAPAASMIPTAFLENLMPLAKTKEAVEAAVAAGDLDKTKAAFGDFKQAVIAVDPTALAGHDGVLWKELAMRLGNDAVVGRESVSLAEAKRRLAELDANWRRLEEAFPMGHAGHAPPAGQAPAMSSMAMPQTAGPTPAETAAAPPKAPPAFQAALGKVLSAYSAVQLALAKDDAAKAKAAVEPLRKAVPSVPMGALSGKMHADWMREKADIDAGLAAMVKAKDLDGLRAGLKPLSKGLAQAILDLGVAEGPYYEIYCPMAFEGQGATWIAPSKTVENPYIGPEMGDCGEVKSQLAPGK